MKLDRGSCGICNETRGCVVRLFSHQLQNRPDRFAHSQSLETASSSILRSLHRDSIWFVTNVVTSRRARWRHCGNDSIWLSCWVSRLCFGVFLCDEQKWFEQNCQIIFFSLDEIELCWNNEKGKAWRATKWSVRLSRSNRSELIYLRIIVVLCNRCFVILRFSAAFNVYEPRVAKRVVDRYVCVCLQFRMIFKSNLECFVLWCSTCCF